MKRNPMGINTVVVMVMLLLVCGGAWTLEKTDLWLDSPGAGDYPDESALILYDNIDFTGNADGTNILSEHGVIKILNEEGLKKYGQILRSYNRSYQNMEIKTARIIRPDGEILDLDREGEIMKEAKFAVQMPHHKDNMIVTLDYSRAEIGDIVEFEIIFTNNRPMVDRYFWSVSYINDEVPILHTIFNAKLHRNADATRWIIANYGDNPPEPVITDIKGGKAFRWELKDRVSTRDEPASPAFRDRVAYFIISNCPDWKDLSREYYRAMEPFITPDRKMINRVREMTAQADGDMQKLTEILRFIKSKQTITWQFEPDRIDLYPPGEIIDSKGMTKQDACLLFIAMARAVGMEAHAALISDQKHGQVHPQVPSPYQFSHVLALVKVSGEWKLIDPTLPMSTIPRLGSVHEGCTYLPLTPRGSQLKETAVSPPEANREEIISDGQLTDDGGLGINMRLIETGNKQLFWSTIMNMMKAAGKERDVVARMAQIVHDRARLLSYNISSDPDKAEMVMEVTFMVDEYPVVSGPFRVLKLPVAPAKNPEFLGDNLMERENPIFIGNKTMDIKKVTLKMPDGYEIISMPPRVNIENSIGSLKIDRSFREGVFDYHYALTIDTLKVEKSQFPQLVELYENAFAATKESVIFRKK